MIYFECQKLKVLTLTALLGSLLLISSCGQSLESHLTRGEEYLKARKYDAALMQFRAAVDIDENSKEAQWGLARAYEKQEKFLETIEALRRVIDLAPENLEAQSKLGNYYLLFNPPQIQEAERILADIRKRDPKFIEGHILHASILSIRGKREKEIVPVLRRAISFDKKRTESYLALSRFYMTIDKADEAEATIKEGIKANPGRALGHVEYGRFLTYTDRADEAEKQFVNAVKLEPKDIDTGLAMASFYTTNRQYEKAEKKLLDLARLQENSPESGMDLGNFYRLVDREDDAIRAYQQILTEYKDFARARYALAGIYLGQKDFVRVQEQIDALLSINDQDAEALMIRAKVNLADNKPEEAVKDLEEVLKKQPSLGDALYNMVRARLALGQIDQARAFIGDLEKYHPNFKRLSLVKIEMAFSANEPEKALAEAKSLIFQMERAFSPDVFKAQENEGLRVAGITARGLAYLRLGKIQEAKADLTEVVRLSPDSAGAKVNLAKVYLAGRDLNGAENLYSRALENDKGNFDALSGLVSVLNRRGKFKSAGSRIDANLKSAAGDKNLIAALYFLKSEVFSASGNANAAETELKKSIKEDENYLPSYSAYASLLISRNQTDEALKQYQTVADKKPSPSVYTLIGMLEDGRGKYVEAEKHYRKALEMNPDTPIAANNLAWLIADSGRGNLDEAMRLAREVTMMNPKISSYYDTLGWVYYKKGFRDQAVEQFKKAVALDLGEAQQSGRPTNPGYRLRLGMALHSAGQKVEAKREIAVALSTGNGQFSPKELQSAKQILGES